MAVKHVDAGGHVLVVWKEDAFSTIATDPDSDLSNGITVTPSGYTEGTLVPIREDSGPGVRPTLPNSITQRAQMDRQQSPSDIPGRKGGTIDFTIDAIGGSTEIGSGDTSDGGPYSSLVDMAFGPPMTTPAYTTASAGSSTTSFTLTSSTSWAVGQIFSVEDADGTRSISQVVALPGSDVVTCYPALGFTPAATDKVRPLMTWDPHDNYQGHPTGYVKVRVRDSGTSEGKALDFSGCGLTLALETPDVGMPLGWHFSGMADDWAARTIEDVDISASIDTTAPPVLLTSKFYLDSTEYELVAGSIDTGLQLAEKKAHGSAQGRGGWTHFGSECVWSVTLLHDQDWLASWSNSTLYHAQWNIGSNSNGAIADADANYFVALSPAVQVRNVEEVAIDGLLYMQLTLVAKRSQIANHINLYPFYFAVAGDDGA